MKSLRIMILAGAAVGTLSLAGCGTIAVMGVPIITTTTQIQFQPSSKYQGLDVRDQSSLNRHLDLIRSVNRTVVEDEYGIFYSEVRGMQVAQFHIAKGFESHFRRSVATGTVLVYPFYRNKLLPDLQPGACELEWYYDRARTERWRNFLALLDFRVRPLDATDEVDRLEHETAQAYLGGTTVPEDQHRKRFASATGPATIFVSDESNQSYRRAVVETKRIDGRVSSRSCPGYTLPSKISLGFFSDEVVKTTQVTNAQGSISAYCSVVNYDAIFNSNYLVEFPIVEAKRIELDRRAQEFCEEAVKAVKLSRKMESQRLR